MGKIRTPSPRQIIALWLQDVKGLDGQQIAKKMKTTVPAVKGLLHRIRKNHDFMKPLQNHQKHRTLRYKPSMDGHIKRKF